MQKHYLTHDVAELLMAYVMCCVGAFALYMCWIADAVPIVARLFLLAFIPPLAVMVYVFLFHMSGSRKRREEAEKA